MADEVAEVAGVHLREKISDGEEILMKIQRSGRKQRWAPRESGVLDFVICLVRSRSPDAFEMVGIVVGGGKGDSEVVGF